jgi:phosphoglucosamine mutase
MMEAQGWHLGGESSGHLICSDVTTTGDGIVSSLQVLLALRSFNTSLRGMLDQVPLFPQTMINVRVAPGSAVQDSPEIAAAVRAVEAQLGDSGRVLLRPSGTEPVIRVMVEGRDSGQVAQLCRSLADSVEGLLTGA